MRVLILTLLPSLCASVAFESRQCLVFGVRGGGTENKLSKQPDDGEEHKRFAATILAAVGKVETALAQAIETEVDTIFHKSESTKKAEVSAKAKKAVEKGAAKVKKAVSQHAEEGTILTHYPYAWPEAGPEHEVEVRLLHAVEKGEKALLHAIEEEVGALFHELKHREDKHMAKSTEEVIKKSVKKTAEKVKERHTHRRQWLKDARSSIEEYMYIDFE